MELSGHDAMFVLDDADVTLAARAACFGATVNRGQTCIAVRRVLVHRSLYPAFLEALKPLVAAVPPMRLALASQVRQAEQLVQQALEEGARLLESSNQSPTRQRGIEALAGASGSDSGTDCRLQVVLDVRPEMTVWRQASFASLLAVVSFDTLDEALRLD